MAQYFNKSAVVAEIERLKTIYNDDENIHHVARFNNLCDILSFIDTLEVKEVDLVQEIDSQWKDCAPVDEGMGSEFANISIEQFANIAKHFFNLGLNARKED